VRLYRPPIVAARREDAGVKLINTDGMAFIGPGSEWFWTAASGLVLAVTFIAIYRQLSIARSAAAREELASLQREWDSERQMRYRLEIFVALRDGADRANLPEGPATGLTGWWEGVAQLARSGDIGRKALYTYYRTICQQWWAALAPQARRWREQAGDSALLEDFEWLAGYMAEMDRRTGKAPVEKAWFGSLEEEIAYLQGRIRTEEALRTVIIASPEPVPAAPSATASAAEG
jgi:hypothetical protein